MAVASLPETQLAVEAEYDRTVRADIEKFREQAEAFLAGQITDAEFRGQRLRRGIYGQRQAGVQMIRTKIPGGMMTAEQMRVLAGIADQYAAGKSHLTTRQNVQFHFVPLLQVPGLLHTLADARMTTREACYNTVRNVTCDPLAGFRTDEVFDVRPYARQVALAFLHKELTDNLPRKFKISFSAGASDTMAGAIHDIGFQAAMREGRRGFRMLVGGGLGPLPNEARLLDEFVPVERVVNKCEAVIRVFAEYGNRKNKNKARLKFILIERGFDWVAEQIERHYQDILTRGGIPMPDVIPEGFGGLQSHPPALGTGELLPIVNGAADPRYERWLETNVAAQRQAGYAIVTVTVHQGNLTGAEMRALADLAEQAGDGLIRITIDQNLVFAWVPQKNLKGVYAALVQAGLADSGAGEISDITTCPGAYSCNLALTKSMNLGAAVAQEVRHYDDPGVRKLSVKVSGCPNSCGQHWIADFGFYGNARKIDGRELPYYLMMLGGGNDGDGVMRFGLAVQSLPARLAPVAVRRVIDHWIGDRRAGESFRAYVLRNRVEFFKELTADLARPVELFPEMYKDWGDDTDFSLQLGRGECAA